MGIGTAEVLSVKRTRNSKGHFTKEIVTEIALRGHGVSDPFKKNYFKRTRLPLLAEVGYNAELLRRSKGADAVVLRLVSVAA